MKTNFKILAWTLVVFVTITACTKDEFNPLPDSEVFKNRISQNDDEPSGNDSINPGDSYILKEAKYFKLDSGLIYFTNIQMGSKVRVILHAWSDWYKYGVVVNSGLNVQNWRQTGVILQFELENIEQFKAKTYRIVPSLVNTGYDYQFTPVIHAEKFPNDSLCIGFYHIAATVNDIEWMGFGYTYGFTGYNVLQSGELEVTKPSSNYEFFGKFIDSQGKKVMINFKTTRAPIQLIN